MSMKKVVLILSVLLMVISAQAQSDAILTQQWLSRINCNPAATGNTNDLNIFLLHRTDFSGIENGPQTSLLNATNYFQSINSGVGLSLSYDKEGDFTTNYNAKLAYAYHLKLSESSLLSLGLGLNLNNRTVDFDKARVYHPDPSYEGRGKESKTNLNFDFGLEFSASRFTLGASLNRIGRTDVEKFNSFRSGQQFYGYTRYRISVIDGFDLAPSLAYVYANHMDVWELGATGFIAKQIWVGAAYRWDVAWAFSAGFEFNIFRIGYAYDHYVRKANLVGGTHEVMLSVKIPHKR